MICVSLKLVMVVIEPWTEASMHQAWSELSYIEREQERYMGLRSDTLKELDECRQRAGALENVSQKILLQKTRTIYNFVEKHIWFSLTKRLSLLNLEFKSENASLCVSCICSNLLIDIH